MLNNGFLGFPHNQLNWTMNVALFLNNKDGTNNDVEIVVIKQYKVHCSGYSSQELKSVDIWKRMEHIKKMCVRQQKRIHKVEGLNGFLHQKHPQSRSKETNLEPN